MMQSNAQPRRVLVSECQSGRLSPSSSTDLFVSGSGRCGEQHSRTKASTSSEDDSFDALASLIPAQEFDTPGHFDSSLWHAALHFISRLTGDRIDSAFDVQPGESFRANDNGCREIILRTVPETCLLNDFGASRNLQAASVASRFIRLLLDDRIRLNQPVGDVEQFLQTVKKTQTESEGS